MGITGFIVDQMESTAEWRHGKAEQFPDDERNSQAAEELERLAKEIGALGRSETAVRIDEAEQDDLGDTTMIEWLSEELQAIGFRTSYANGLKFLDAYWSELIENKRRRQLIDEEEQIEDDPKVKAAKAAYNLARTEALARLRWKHTPHE